MTGLVALGYLRVHLLMTETEVADTTEQLARFAAGHGYRLAEVFAEQPHTAPAAFAALIRAVDRYGARAIVVPGVLHLAVLGVPPQLMHYLETVTGVTVLMPEN